MSLEQVDGGVGYYGRFAHGLPTDPSFFPIGVWGAYDQTQANVAKDKAVGLNLYVWNADVAAGAQQNIAAAGMRSIQSRTDGTTNIGPHTAGYMLDDEIDMSQTPSQGLATMQANENEARTFNAGRALYTNYGKGVLLGWGNGVRLTESDRSRYVNDFQELVSSDLYWFTDPWQSDTPADPWLPEHATEADGTISGSQVRRASNYGYQIDEMRRLDSLDGQRKPIWTLIEVGSPFRADEGDGIVRQITPAQMRAAVWHSIIAGARGLIYFQHSFGGPCLTHHALRDPCYADIQAMARAVNGQIRELAPVLNAPIVTSGASTNPTIRALVKWHAGHFYVFAGSKENRSSTGTVSIPCVGDANAIRLGETGSLPVTGGSFTDQFPDGNAIHIYRIDGGSTCGLPVGIEPPATGGGGADPRQPRTARIGRLPRRVSLRSGPLLVPVTCAAACSVRSRLTRRGAFRRVRLASARRRYQVGRYKLVLRLSKRVRRYVARARKPFSMRLDTVIIEPGGAGARRTQHLVARRR